jgi:hypothetical protein
MTIAAKIPKEQVIKYRVTPMTGLLMTAECLGGQLTALADLFRQTSKADGYAIKTVVTKIQTRETGEIEFELAILPLDPELET